MPRAKATTTQLSPLALQKAINKKFGAGTIGFANDPSLIIERIPSGILSLDYILNGGWARGRHAELFGPFSVGKSLLALNSIASAQDMGLRCAYCDAEKSFDPLHAEHQGVNLKRLAFPLRKRRPGEEIIDIMDAHLRSGAYDLIVLDSIAALLPGAEQKESISAASMGTYQAKLMSKAMRKLTAANQDTVLLYINQLRDSVGSFFGPSHTTSGGRAMGFYAGTRLELSKVEDVKEARRTFDARKMKDINKQVVTGYRALVRIEKDKTGSQPKDETTFVYDYETRSIDRLEDLIYLGRRLRLVRAAGDPERLWLTNSPSRKFTGRRAFKKWLAINPVAASELEEAIIVGEEDGN